MGVPPDGDGGNSGYPPRGRGPEIAGMKKVGPMSAWSFWRVVGVIVAVMVAIGGLAVLAYVVIMFVALSQWGSNK